MLPSPQRRAELREFFGLTRPQLKWFFWRCYRLAWMILAVYVIHTATGNPWLAAFVGFVCGYIVAGWVRSATDEEEERRRTAPRIIFCERCGKLMDIVKHGSDAVPQDVCNSCGYVQKFDGLTVKEREAMQAAVDRAAERNAR